MSVLVLPLAHAGHWINAGLYLSPVIVIALLLWFQSRRDKRRPEEAAARDAADEERARELDEPDGNREAPPPDRD